MKKFAELLNRLFFTYSNLGKMALLKNYFATTKDPERGYALAVIAGTLVFPIYRSALIRELIADKIDPQLFALSYDYVGDLSETISLIWPDDNNTGTLPSLTEVVETFQTLKPADIKNYLEYLLNNANARERWAILKLGTDSLRIGVSARFLKQTLAQYGNKSITDIEHLWHGLEPPYISLFAWLEDKAEKPDISDSIYFHPVMLAHPLDDTEVDNIDPHLFAVERKYDGIRIQVISTPQGKALYSRSGDEISHSFPDVLTTINSHVVLDGELVVWKNNKVASFNDLQQRLNRKAPSKKLMNESPAHVILYDILILEHDDLRSLPFVERRKQLEAWYKQHHPTNMSLSQLINYGEEHSLSDVRKQILAEEQLAVEGLMIKRKDSAYIAGRPTGLWYKWKKDPYLVDAVLMYAQRGTGKRSSYYSDFTFGLWSNDELLPIGKAYFGFTDEELLKLDKWIRHHTIKRYGPVRELEKALVFEIAFDAVNPSTRHKSGYALRFPRINRIRWDKPAKEADTLAALKKLSSN